MISRSDLAELLYAACFVEATARKPGNVHPGAAFPDLTYEDFVRSAQAAAPELASARERGVGRTIFEAVSATRTVVASNSNLGMILLLAPLAAVPLTTSLSAGINDVLLGLSVEDAIWAYRGIRAAQPGGMGEAQSQDIAVDPSVTLLEAMRLAADRDLIAKQYVSEFSLILQRGVSWLSENWHATNNLETAVIRLQLQFLAVNPDSLIVRKCGSGIAEEASDRARRLLDLSWPKYSAAADDLAGLDVWLRADGHRRNPGTTADLIAATLFAAFRENALPLSAVGAHA